jgi:hypothetical protein
MTETERLKHWLFNAQPIQGNVMVKNQMTKHAFWLILLFGPIPQLSEAASTKMARRTPVRKSSNIISKNAKSNHRRKGEGNRGENSHLAALRGSFERR